MKPGAAVDEVFWFPLGTESHPSNNSLKQDGCQDKYTADTCKYKVSQAVEQEEIPDKENKLSKSPQTANP